MRGERIKSPKVYGWIDRRVARRPFARDDYNAAWRKAAEYCLQHLNEWIGTADIARAVGRTTGAIDSVIADLEARESPVLLIHDDDRPQKNLMPVLKGKEYL